MNHWQIDYQAGLKASTETLIMATQEQTPSSRLVEARLSHRAIQVQIQLGQILKPRNVSGPGIFFAVLSAGTDRCETNTNECNEKQDMFIHCFLFNFGHSWHRHITKCIKKCSSCCGMWSNCTFAALSCDPSGKFVCIVWCLSVWYLQTFYSLNIATHSSRIKNIDTHSQQRALLWVECCKATQSVTFHIFRNFFWLAQRVFLGLLYLCSSGWATQGLPLGRMWPAACHSYRSALPRQTKRGLCTDPPETVQHVVARCYAGV